MTSKVHWKLEGNVAVITLANAPLNLIDARTMNDFGEAVVGALESPARAVLLKGDGKMFSGGADVSMFQGVDGRQARQMFARWLPFLHRLEDAPVPTIAAVHNMCITGGLELALACDVIIAAEGTRFGQTEASIGVTTLLGGAQRIAQRAGVARARSICFDADIYSAEDFERWGIVDRIVPAATWELDAMGVAEAWATGATAAHGAVKAMIRVSSTSGVRAADAFLLDRVVDVFDTHDMKHGVDTLLEKGAREAKFHMAFEGR